MMCYYKSKNLGFSLVEVMIAAALLGALSLFSLSFFSDQLKKQKTLVSKIDELSLINDMRLLLMSEINCSATLRGQILDLNLDGIDELEEPLDALTKVYLLESEDTVKSTEVMRYPINQKMAGKNIELAANRLLIKSYKLDFDEEKEELMKEFGQAEISLLVEFDRGKKTYGSSSITYKIPLEVRVDEKFQLSSCSSLGIASGGQSSGAVVDAKYSPSALKKTGNQVCKERSSTCAYVMSTNFVFSSKSGNKDTPAALVSSCLTAYNQNLPGVKNGAGLSNIHSCEALLGVHKTLEINSSQFKLVCAGIFSAVCN